MKRIGPILALVACEVKEADPVDSGVAGPLPVSAYPHACDPVVWVPSPTGGPAVPAPDAHADVAGPLPTPFAVHLGVPSSDPSTSASFVWRTDVDTLATVLEYGEGTALDRRVEGTSFRYGAAVQGTGDARVHEVKLCDALAPATTYSYRVGGQGGWSPTFTFTTAPPPGEPATFRVAVSGDSRGTHETWAAVVALMESHDPDLYLFTGDLVNFGVSQAEWDSWWAATGDVFARKPFLPAHGNHEFLAQHWFAQMSLPNNEEWYGTRWGDVTIAVLNDTVRDTDVLAGAEVDLLDEAFAAAPGDWKLVTHHQAEYAVCTTHASNLELRATWSPVYDRHAVDLVLSGHNHTYERSVPIRAEAEVAPDEGTAYVVTGGAGAPLYAGRTEEWFNAVSAPVEHYLIVDVTPTEMHVVARDLAGNTIDDFTLAR